MRQENWKNKIQIIRNIECDDLRTLGNSMGIYFEKNFEKHLIVYFKPLNEDFDKSVFGTNKGTLINFERDLIDEDDIEYALDVMSLFNKYPKFVLSEESEIQQIQHLIKLLNNEFCNDSVSYIMLKTLLKVLLLHLIWNTYIYSYS
ncbi:hypothetical protein MKD41_13300 [Lutibacter sp. A64]|uniref:hypothetical protein n=1 Tax=Lutibacter sp. A64 TaxID=2918526 RepID=UPI001F066287|nr:hypothetical protein [Lutibacter sp. A64]UMB53303.1 hypothetical protein MKD41_13300 [Lutibacter sp. A64]